MNLKSDKKFIYPVIRSNRKSCSIKIKADGSVTVYAPRGMPLSFIEMFVYQKKDWIEKTQEKILSARAAMPPLRVLTEDEIKYLSEDAKRLIPPRVNYFARQMGVSFKRITIRTQRTRWGSCSSKDNLNFNCLLMLAPEEVLDYVIVHELCHLKEMNHSKKFWSIVESTLPDYKDNGHTFLRTCRAQGKHSVHPVASR